MDERFTDALSQLADYTSQHVLLSAAALALGVAISLPVAVLASRRPRLRFTALAVASPRRYNDPPMRLARAPDAGGGAE